ncbi:MAG: hypothetical protein ACYC9O_04230 [Candidatus Latescibacterota bacterium]
MKKMLFILTIVFGLVASYFALAQQTKYTYTAYIKPLFAANCSNCHSWDGAYANLVGPVSTESATRGIPIVYKTKPDSSVLVWRLEGKLPSGGSIEQMPKFGTPLSSSAQKIVRDWIAQGAPESQPVKVEERSWSAVKELFR